MEMNALSHWEWLTSNSSYLLSEPCFRLCVRSVYVAKPKRYFSSSGLMPSEAQMCLEAST